MPGEFIDNTSAVQNPTLVTTNETLIHASALQSVHYSSGIVFNGTIYVTPGTGTTAITVRVRGGYGTGGPIKWQISFPVTAGQLNALPISGVCDAEAYRQPGGSQLTFSLQQVGATANGNVTYGSVALTNSQVTDMGLSGTP